MRLKCLFLLLGLASTGFAAVCDAEHFPGGAYGFELSGSPTISGSAKPAVTVGRLILNTDGTLNGYSSLNFGGWYVGNPVTGSYQLRRDCSLTFRLQDDSGNFQNFAGALNADGRGGAFQQTDAGAHSHGVLIQSAAACSEADLRPGYRFRVAGHAVDMGSGAETATIAEAGTMAVSGGSLTVHGEDASVAPTAGSYSVGSDCFVELEFAAPSTGQPGPPRKFRGVLVNGGAELLGVETDPATAVTLSLSAR